MKHQKIVLWTAIVTALVIVTIVILCCYYFQLAGTPVTPASNTQTKTETKTQKISEDGYESEHIYPQKTTFEVKDEYRTVQKSIILPTLRDIQDPAVLDKAQNTLDFVAKSDSLLEEAKNFPSGLTDVDYKVHYDKDNVLSLSIYSEYVGAYPSSNTSTYTINLTTGEPVKLSDIFYQTKIAALINLLNQKLQVNIDGRITEAKEDNPSAADGSCSEKTIKDGLNNYTYEYGEGKFTESKATFRVTSDGLEFLFDFGFPHVILACEPEGRISLNYIDLKDYLNPAGLLGKEIK